MQGRLLMVWVWLGAAGGEPPSLDRHGGESEMAVSFEAALGLVEEHPYPKSLREASRAKEGRDRQTKLGTQGPQLQVMPGIRLLPRQAQGFELQGSVVQPWSLERYGRKRIEAAKAETAVLSSQAQGAALESRLGAARAWVDVWSAAELLALALDQREIRGAWLARVVEARREEVATVGDVAMAETALAIVHARVVEAEGAVHDLGLVLAAEIGRGGVVVAAEGEPPAVALPSPEVLRQAFAALDTLPMVTVHRLESRWQRALAVEAKANAGATMNAGVYGQREGTGDVAVMGVLGLDVPLSRAQTQVSSHLAQARIAEGQEQSTRERLASHLATVVHELEHSRRREAVLREQVVPSARALVEARQAALGLGESTWVLFLDAQDSHAEARMRLQQAEAARRWAEIEAWLYLDAMTQTGAHTP